MSQKITQAHDLDHNGNPTGGKTSGIGIEIKWQDGPLGGDGTKLTAPPEPNGAFVEGVISAAIGRIQFYQTASGGKFACRENAIALTHLETALLWLARRFSLRP